jgi:integrase
MDDEIETILSGIDRFHLYGDRNAALVRLMLDGGLRLNEACELRIEEDRAIQVATEYRVDWFANVEDRPGGAGRRDQQWQETEGIIGADTPQMGQIRSGRSAVW